LLTATVGLAVVAVILAITGPHLVHLFDTTVANCNASGDCSTATSEFLRSDRSLQIGLDALVVIVPGILGLFWGAPLVASEIEAGTWRLAWTQSVTRTRWLAVKLSVIGLASMTVAGLLSLMVTWWSSPVDRANMSPFVSFDQRGIVPIGYAALAFVLGVAFGVLIRRTVPAMAATLVTFVAARLCFTHWIRPHLIAPAHQSLALNPASPSWGFGSESSFLGASYSNTLIPGPTNIPNAWVYSTQLVDKAGGALTSQDVARACPLLAGGGGGGGGGAHVPAPGGGQTLEDCVRKVGATFHEVVSYQPGNRYWAFQWHELAIYLGAAVILGGFCLWWVRRRLI
jgi:hypothetical protein